MITNTKTVIQRIKELHYINLDGILDEAIREHDSRVCNLDNGPLHHSIVYWDSVIGLYTLSLPEHERVSEEKLKRMLEGKARRLRINKCAECERVAIHLFEAYKLD